MAWLPYPCLCTHVHTHDATLRSAVPQTKDYPPEPLEEEEEGFSEVGLASSGFGGRVKGIIRVLSELPRGLLERRRQDLHGFVVVGRPDLLPAILRRPSPPLKL